MVLGFIVQSGAVDVERLWVLVNERTGIVDDYVYRTYADGTAHHEQATTVR